MFVGRGRRRVRRMTYDGFLNKGLMKRFPSAPFQIRSRIDLARRDIRAAQTMMTMERESIPAIL